MNKLFAACLIAALCLAGCASSSPHEKITQKDSVFRNTMPFRFAVEQKEDDLVFTISTAFINKLLEPVPIDDAKLEWSELYIYDSNDSLLWRERKSIAGKKTETSMPEVVQMTAYNDYLWKPSSPSEKPFAGKARIKVYQRGDVMVFDSTISFTYVQPQPKPLSLRTNIDQQDNHRFLINLTVTREAAVANEFLPNSLTHDYKIYDSQGTLLWQMSYQKMYMQMIMDVAPKNIGEQAYYTDEWNGEGNVVPGVVPAGEYKLVAIIPCKPQAIVDSVMFKIK
ncbi:MAG TPA: BsuPI-related putative proteinase inhibitor [Candidatus Kapabacteria bacterium]|nr:BsuPI-related putative proteinase inhibitor [Candidatus Kapabacteria bacterium]